MDDLKAIAHLKRGDIAGLSTLVAHYQVRPVRTAYLITQNESAAQDIVQEAFLEEPYPTLGKGKPPQSSRFFLSIGAGTAKRSGGMRANVQFLMASH